MSRKRSELIEIDVSVNGQLVKQPLMIEDWSFTTGMPVNGESEFHLRHVRPLASMRRGVLRVLVDDLMNRAGSDAVACQQLAVHLRGLYLNPDTVLNHRALTARDLENSLHAKTLGNRSTWIGKFEALVSSYTRKIEVGTDLDHELVSALMRLPFEVSAAQQPAQLFLKSVALKHNALFAQLRRENAGNLDRAIRKPTPHECAGRRRIRQMLLDRLPDDKLASRASAYRYSCQGDALVEQANRIILDALRAQMGLTAPEVRLFEQLYLRWRLVTSGPMSFDGIFGHRPLLLSILRFSPTTIAYLVLARCWDQPSELRTMLELDLQIQLIAALRAAMFVLEKSREAECESRKRRRPPTDGSAPPRSGIFLDAEEVVANADRATPRQLEVCRRVVESATIIDAARSLGIPYQAVQNAVRRGVERARRPDPAAVPRKRTSPHPDKLGELSARPPCGGPNAKYISSAVIRRRPCPADPTVLGERRNARAAP